jgi:hypothetical protein
MATAATPDTTYTWNVANLERSLADGMVTTVHYTITAHDGTYSTSAYGSVGLEPADPDSMVPFADLDEFTVASWVANQFGDDKVQEIQQALQGQIDLQRNPVTGAGVPWQ